jgi:hypothetical protein
LLYSGSLGVDPMDITVSGSTYSTFGSDAIARMNALASLAFSLRSVVTTSDPIPIRRKWCALAGKALASLSSFDWAAVVETRSALPVLYLMMKRSVDVSGAMLLVFIFNDVARVTALELAALAAAATSAVLCAAGDAAEVGSVPLSPPHAVSASESAMQTLPESTRWVLLFDHSKLSLLIDL